MNLEEMEMPTPCEHCKEWFDLNDGCGSVRWYKGITICSNCYADEAEEIERDEAVFDLINEMQDAKVTFENAYQGLIHFGVAPNSKHPSIDDIDYNLFSILKKAFIAGCKSRNEEYQDISFENAWNEYKETIK